jgi:two-component system sensor histidine kinase YesM
VLPLTLIAYVSFFVSDRILQEKSMEFITGTVAQVGREINGLLGDAVELAQMASSEPIVQQALRQNEYADIAERYAQELRIDSRLNFIQSYMVSDIFGIYVIGTDGGLFKSNYTTFRSDSYREAEWFRTLISSPVPVWYSTPDGALAVDTLPEPFVTVGIPVIDKATGDTIGVALVDFGMDTVQEILVSAAVGRRGVATLFNHAGEAITSWPPDRENAYPEAPPTGEYVSWSEAAGGSTLTAALSLLSGWTLVSSVPVSEIVRESRMSGLVIMFTLIAIASATTIAGSRFSRSISGPIVQVTETMRLAEVGNLDARVRIERTDEIGDLADGFNTMIDRIGILMDRIAQEQQELAIAEVRNLQAQINPHFLYNTLDSIVWLSLAGRSDAVVETTRALTRLFRRSLSGGRDIIPLRDEIEHVESYLTIQRIRYADRLTFTVVCPDALKSISVLKLTLQPLVENSLYHGIKPLRRPGEVSVEAWLDEDDLVCEVRDNGVGMDQSTLDRIDAELSASSSRTDVSPHIGLRNVHRRIQLVAGERYGLAIASREGEGTSVRVTLPRDLELQRREYADERSDC